MCVNLAENLSVKEKIRRFSTTDIPSTPTTRVKKMDLSLQVEAKRELLDTAGVDLGAELKQDPAVLDDLKVSWAFYKLMHQGYTTVVNTYQEHNIKKNKAADYKKQENELSTYIAEKMKFEMLVENKLPPTKAAAAPPDSSLKITLPKRELPQFTGEVREYLPFWASFKEIDADANLSDGDKFHYLLQSTQEGSAARKLLQSFPFSSDNYKPALKNLKERFGRNTVLIKVYVRDLLQLVIGASTGTSVDFCDLVTNITSQIRNLATLGVTNDKCAQILYPVVEACLPTEVLQAWQRHAGFKEDLEDMLTFLQGEVNNITDRDLAHFQVTGGGNADGGRNSSSSHKRMKNKGDVATTTSFINSSNNSKQFCAFCDKAHQSSECRSALGMLHNAKKDILKQKNICFVCLRKSNHFARECRFRTKCSICQRNHFAIMCPNQDKAIQMKNQSTAASSSQSANKQGERAAETTNSCSSSSEKEGETTSLFSNQVKSPAVPLQTLLVKVHGKNGSSKIIRAMVDGGSQKSYILSSLASELEFKTSGEETASHQVFGGDTGPEKKHKIVKVFVTNTEGRDNCNFDCLVIESIAYRIAAPAPGPWMEEFKRKGIMFNDSTKVSRNIEMVIGNDIAPRVYTGRMHHLSYGPSALETRWGWVMGGKLPLNLINNKTYTSFVSTVQSHKNPIAAIWELEAIGIMDPVEKESRKEMELMTQQHFEKTVVQLPNGRYQVCLPWITGTKEKLPINFHVAERRLKNTTRDLQCKGFLEKYDQLFRVWEEDNLIEEVPSNEISHVGHYLPHRAVVKLSSATTPIRPVFDGSCAAKGRFSLNDCLDKGPNMLELIPPILTRFRLRKIGVLADIKRAFQQISITPSDRDHLRFLWWKDLSCKELKYYRHCRVVFGVTSSPYLLGATLHHHLKREIGTDGSMKKVITDVLQSTYVDNTILSVDSIQEADKFQKTATSLLSTAQFDLRGWEYGPGNEDKHITVLGLIWNKKTDMLSLDVSKINEKIELEPTLRHLLSLVHMVYDPLGFASPFTVVGKLLLRSCHDLKCGLDTPLPEELKKEVLKWARQIPTLADLQIPRHVHFGENANYSIHIFCDASSSATAAAVFLRVEVNNIVMVFLLVSKARVAPRKKASIPRLELIACLIGSRLLQSILEYIGIADIQVTLWSDSSTALAWLRGTGPWGVFVTNCVEKVKKLTSISAWRHVPGKINIADLPSRGCSANKLIESRWWSGPEWLKLPSTEWPLSEEIPDMELIDTERKKTVAAAIMVEGTGHLIEEFLRVSDYPRILKCISYWLRAKYMLKKNKQNQLTADQEDRHYLSAEELDRAEHYIILHVQEEFRQHPEKIKKLDPFKDGKGIMRTRTRLTMEEDDEDFQHPILLPEKNEFVRRLIRWEHSQHSHVGATTLLAILRERFWIVNGRRTVRGVLTKCWVCKRFTSSRNNPPQGPLPKSRSHLEAPFTVTGVDAAGPLFLKGGGGKVWILLFTCATFRAVHLELVDTLSAEGFIRALRRFVSRRGRPSVIYSDNARGFVAAHKSFQQLKWEKVEQFATVSRIQWRFIPPISPWWGGFWERLIGLAKQLLRRVLGKRVVNQGELEMLMLEVEEALNNRPLTHTSEDPGDPMALTPNHFLRWSGRIYLPEADLLDAATTRKAHKKLQHLREALRSRFRKEYLGLLRGHYSSKSSSELKNGDVVLLEHDNVKRLDWPMGVIVESIQGRDGVNRLFRVKTKTGELLRPAQRLFLMEQETPGDCPGSAAASDAQ